MLHSTSNKRRRHNGSGGEVASSNNNNNNLAMAAATMAVTAACLLSCITSPSSVDAFSTYSSNHNNNNNRLLVSPMAGRITSSSSSSTTTKSVNNKAKSSSTALSGKLWDKLQIEEDDYPDEEYPELSWYVINCVAGVELELLRQVRETVANMPKHDVDNICVPTKRTMRSHGNRNVLDVKVMYPGYVFCKIRMCPATYEPLQALALTRSWISGTVNRRGYKKLPPAPVALNEDEVEKFGLLEEQMEKYESVHGIDGKGDTGEDLIEQYKGFEVEGMVKVIGGRFKGEDGIVRRLKDGKICIRMYTYGTTFDEWLPPEELRPLTDLEIMRGLSGPTVPVNQDEFNESIGMPVNRNKFDGERAGGRGGDREVRSSIRNAAGGAGEGRRMRRQDRTSRGEKGGDTDLFGRSNAEAKREEENWRDYRERQRAQQREERRGDSWGIKERSSWGGGDENVNGRDDRAAYDVDSQWGRSDMRSGRQQRRDKRRESEDERKQQNDGVERALSGEGDWSAFASGGSGSGANSKEDDFFDSLMSELSDTLDGKSSSAASGGGGSSSSSSAGKESDEDDFFNSLMSDIDDTLDTSPSSGSSGSGGGDEDDFFASLESELSDALDAPTSSPSSSSKPMKSSGKSNSGGGDEDDFFASLEAELSDTLDSPIGNDNAGSSTKKSSKAVDDDDFFAMLEADLASGGGGDSGGDVQSSASSDSKSSGDDFFSEDDFFANLEAEVASAADKPVSTSSKPKKTSVKAVATAGGGGEDLSKLTVPLLKEKLKERGLKVSGKKADLIERLQEAGN